MYRKISMSPNFTGGHLGSNSNSPNFQTKTINSRNARPMFQQSSNNLRKMNQLIVKGGGCGCGK